MLMQRMGSDPMSVFAFASALIQFENGYVDTNADVNGLVTLHRTGKGTGTGTRTRTIGNNGSWPLSLAQTSVNISS